MSKLIFSIASSIETAIVLMVVCLVILVRLFFVKPVVSPVGKLVLTQVPISGKPGDPHPTYSTNPPTSGFYTANTIREGFYTNPIRDEQIVSALHDGWVGIFYNCQYKAVLPTKIPVPSPSVKAAPKSEPQEQSAVEVLSQVNAQNRECGETLTTLRKIVEDKGTDKLIIAPRSNLETRVSLVAWGRIEELLWVDKEKIRTFIDLYRDKAVD